MQTHIYWKTYEEYLAYGIAPRKPRFNEVISYRRTPKSKNMTFHGTPTTSYFDGVRVVIYDTP